jgi:hypothetical protein
MSISIGSNSNGDLEIYTGITKILTADAGTGVVNFDNGANFKNTVNFDTANFKNGATAPTVAAGTNDNHVATTGMVHSAIANDLHVTGSAPMYACRAWVNFDGTQSTPTIRASGNVSSITKNGTGSYTINFTIAMPDTSYNIVCGNDTDDNSISNFTYNGPAASRQLGFASSEKTTSLCKIYAGCSNPVSGGSSSRIDFKEINVAIFR